VSRSGSVALTENNILDSGEETMSYMLGSISFSRAEQLENRGEEQYIPLIASKMDVLEKTQMNKFHEGVLSAGTAVGGLQMGGLAEKVSTTPTSGTVMGINRATAGAEWSRNSAFATATDWSDGSVDSGNVTRFLDQGIDATTMNSMPTVQLGLLGSTHWAALSSAVRAVQQIVHEKDTAKVGFNKIIYRGIPQYLSGGINYSGFSAQTATRSYLLNVQRGGFNVVFMKGAEFDMLEPVNSADSATVSRLMFTMVCTTIGALAKRCWVGFDA
jgi:hypothetical protein